MIKGRLAKTDGNILDFMTVGITLLAIMLTVLAFFHSMNLMFRKLEISQTARKYILMMETTGCLTEECKLDLLEELEKIGLQEIDLSETTLQPVGYGEEVVLKIRGKLSGNRLAAEEDIWTEGFKKQGYYVEELRVSTAKN